MTTIYFIRHAEPNYSNHDDLTRELTPKGLHDCQLLLPFFENTIIDDFYSSPYKRAIDTIKPLAEQRAKTITLVNNFRERRIDDNWIDDFNDFCQKQWHDKTYKLSDGESLQEVQERQLLSLHQLLTAHEGQTLVIGSHGTALSALVNHYQPRFDFQQFQAIKSLFPFVVRMTFTKLTCQSITLYNIFTEEIDDIYST